MRRALRTGLEWKPFTCMRLQLDRVICAVDRLSPTPLNLSNFECGAQKCQELPLGQMLVWIIRAVALMKTPTWYMTASPSTRDKWAKGLHCGPEIDAWACMFGENRRGVVPCYGNETVPENRTLVALAMIRAVLLQGKPQSPLLAPEPEPMLTPHKITHKFNISVHVRGGDSCDHRINTTGTVPAFRVAHYDNCGEFGRITSRHHTTKHPANCFSRSCVDASVHYRMLQDLMQRLGGLHKVDKVFLATDDVDAVRIFSNVRGLVVHSMDRENLRYGHGWIEKRVDLNITDVTLSTLTDLRLLSNGHVLIASMCSYFSRLAWNMMVARHEHDIPWYSTEKCLPHLFQKDAPDQMSVNDMEKEDITPGSRWKVAKISS